MRRFVTLVFLLFFTIPFGISISGCSKKTATVFCNGGDSGPVVGQLFSIALQPKLFGISLNTGQIGQVSQPSPTDCKGSVVTVGTYIYGTTDMTLADVEPSNGRLCAGTWNRNTGGGIADYTTCNPTGKSGTAYITASAQGAVSNPIAVYVHPVVTSVVLGPPSADCTNDPATNCAPTAINSSVTNASLSCPVSAQNPSNPLMSNGCCTIAPSAVLATPTYSGSSCLSQSNTGLLTSRVYAGSGSTRQNISCQAGYLSYSPQTTGIVSIDQNGVATAQAPGSTIITATLSNAGSSAGFFATCPPASITLSTPSGASNNITVNQNFTQAITPTVIDTKGVTLTGVTLSYVSTTPTTLPTSATPAITPLFPGAGTIVAICQPPACNPTPFNQIGLFGNGTPVVSNALNVTTPGTNSTVLYIGSTQSQYVVPVDFTSTTLGAPVRLPYVPNSMVISDDGSTIYMGSATELMTFNAVTNSLSKEDPTVSGPVLAISPDGNTLVISDPIRQLVYLYGSSGGITTSYGGVGTHAEFSPDSSTVYITAGNQILVHSTFTGWSSISGSTVPALTTPATDVAVTVPDLGAFFAGATTTARGNCPLTTVSSTNGQLSTTNVLYPDAGVTGDPTDRLAATNDGKHIIGATVTSGPTLTDLSISSLNAGSTAANSGSCPANGTGLKFTTSPAQKIALPITATSITGVVPSSDSSNVFVTYTSTATTGGTLPLYQPAATGPGTLSSVTLSTVGATAPVAPVAGVFSADNLTFYAGTTGDNLVHILTKSGSSFVDTTKPINPQLPGTTTGTIAAAELTGAEAEETALTMC